MLTLSLWLYQSLLWCYRSLIFVAAKLGHSKAQQWWYGRQESFSKVQTFRRTIGDAPVLWVHCASLGEFEQGRPVIEALLERDPNTQLFLSFFSPSGYTTCQNYAKATTVAYLPMDAPTTAARFLDLLAPDQVIFVKYEFWYHYLTQLKNRQIPTYLISARFRPKQIFFRWYGHLFRTLLDGFTQIFVQDVASAKLLQDIDYNRTVVAGDTRLDRVLSIQAQAKNNPIIAAFQQTAPLLVAGSTWPPDEALLATYMQQQSTHKLLLVPHEVDEGHLKSIEQKFQHLSCKRYSACNANTDFSTIQVVLMDQIGLLSMLYRYGNWAYIGGGFGKGIHNCLEAVVYKLPIFFGPNHHKFLEAKQLLAAKIALEVQDATQLSTQLQQLNNLERTKELQQAIEAYIQASSGATAIILEHLSTSD